MNPTPHQEATDLSFIQDQENWSWAPAPITSTAAADVIYPWHRASAGHTSSSTKRAHTKAANMPVALDLLKRSAGLTEREYRAAKQVTSSVDSMARALARHSRRVSEALDLLAE